MCSSCATTDEVTQDDRSEGATDGVARTTKLNQLVTTFATTAKGVEHWVHHDIEQAHGETSDESAQYVHAKALCIATQPLYAYAYETYGYCQERSELITLALENNTCWPSTLTVSSVFPRMPALWITT